MARSQVTINKVLILLIVVAFFISLGLSLQNDWYERHNNQVELVVDINETEYIIGTAGLERMEFYSMLKDMGVTGIAVWDVNLEFPWLEELTELGFNLVARPTNRELTGAENVTGRLEQFAIPSVTTYMFEGSEVSGYPVYLEETAAFFNEQGLTVTLDKFRERQRGVGSLVEQIDYRVITGHTNWPNTPGKTIAYSAWENRMRLLDLRFDLTREDLVEEVEELIIPLVAELHKRGMTTGTAQPIPTTDSGPLLLFILILGGVIAPLLLLADQLFVIEKKMLVAGLVGLGALLSVVIIGPGNYDWIARQASWAASLIFPVLAVISQQLNLKAVRSIAREQDVKKKYQNLIRIFMKTILISLIGGTIVYGITTRPYFLSGLAAYQGVKLAHLLPLPVVFYQAILVYHYQEDKWDLKKLPTRLGQLGKALLQGKNLIFLGIVALAGVYYIGRTGHTAGMPVLELEIKVRNYLQDALWVRPRFKEYLLGHPAALLALTLLGVSGSKPGRPILLLIGAFVVGAIGQISILNAFSHWATPYYISLLRTFNGVWLGVLTGLLLVMIYYGVVSLLERMGSRK